MAKMNVDIIETNLTFVKALSQRASTDMIVIHHTGSSRDMDASAEQIHGWHINQNWAGIGYHFVIRKDGTIERGRPEWAVGSHAYGHNGNTIGIHLSGDFNAAMPTEMQIEKCAMLVAWLCEKYGIPADRNHVLGHGELDPTVTPKGCPGINLYEKLDTIAGKANWYLHGPEETRSEEEAEMRYNTLGDMPVWAQPTIQKMMEKGLLNGDGKNLDLSLDMIRVFVINDRAGLY